MGAPSKIAFALWGREGTAHFRRLTPSFAAQKPHRTRVEPAAAVLIRADGAQGIWGSLPRGRGKHSWDAAAAQGRRETRDGSVRGARLGTAHSRRLMPPSFAAQNPRHCDARPQHGIVDEVGCSHRASAMGNPPWRSAAWRALRARRGGIEGLGRSVNRSLENRCWVVGPRGNRSLSAADAAFVRGTEPAAIFIHADVPQGHGGSLENRRWVVGPRGNRSLSAADAAFVRGTEAAAIFIHAVGPQGYGGSVENRRWVVGPRGNRSLSAADAAFVRGSDHRWRRLRSRHRSRRDFHPCSWPAGSWGLPRKSPMGCGAAREPLTFGG
jgi:hypothetical protein